MLVGYFSANEVACRHVRVHLVWLNSPLSQLRKLFRAGGGHFTTSGNFLFRSGNIPFWLRGRITRVSTFPRARDDSEKFIPSLVFPSTFRGKGFFWRNSKGRFCDPHRSFLIRIIVLVIFTCCKHLKAFHIFNFSELPSILFESSKTNRSTIVMYPWNGVLFY